MDARDLSDMTGRAAGNAITADGAAGASASASSSSPAASSGIVPNPSRRMKMSESTDSLPNQSDTLLWEMASELPDELIPLNDHVLSNSIPNGLTLCSMPSGLLTNTPTLSTSNNSISSSNNNNNNNPLISTTSTVSHLSLPNNGMQHQSFSSQPQQQQQQQQQQQSAQPQLSQMLSQRSANVTAMPGQRQMLMTSSQQVRPAAPLQNGPAVSSNAQQQQMRYTGPQQPGMSQQAARMTMQMQPQQQPQQSQFQMQPDVRFSPMAQQQTQRPQQPNQIRFTPGQQQQSQQPVQQQQQQQQQTNAVQKMQPQNQPQQQQMLMHGAQPQQQLQSGLMSASGMTGLGSGPGTADPEKRKLIQQQLVLLLHAHKCQRREQQNPNETARQCQLPHCRTMKSVLNHMTACVAGKGCTVPHCASSRQIISHWKNCNRQDCPVCLPLKQASDRRQQQQQLNPIMPVQNLLPSQSPALPTVAPNNNNGSSSVNSNVPSPAVSQMQQQQPPPPQTQMQVLSNSNQSSQPLEIPSSTPSMANAYQVLGLPYNNSVGSPSRPSSNGIGSTAPARPAAPGTPGSQPGQAVVKEWHVTVTQDLRNHLIQKIVQAIFPTTDPNAYRDRRMNNLVAYAEKVERDMYDTANSREEYYHLLAEKIYKIQKELEEKRLKRREQQQQLQSQQLPSGQLMGQQPQVAASPRPLLTTETGGQRMQSVPQRMNVNMAAPPNVNIMNHNANQTLPNQMQQGMGQSQQQFFLPPNQQVRANMSPAAGSAPFGSGLTLQGMLASTGSAQQPLPGTPGLTQPHTPQSSATPPHATPPPRPASNSGMLQQQLMSQPMPTARHESGIDNDMTLDKLLPIKNEPKADLDDFLSGGLSNSSSGMPAIKSEPAAEVVVTTSAATPSSSGVAVGLAKKEQPDEDQMDSNDDSSMKGVKREREDDSEPCKSKPNLTSSSPVPASVKAEPRDSPAPSPSAASAASSSASSATTVRQKKVFKPNEIRQALMPTLEKLLRQDPESLPFRQPVDPILLGIPDYFDLITRPMDLSTIKKRLDHGEYQDPWQYVDDVYLMFDNARLYNRKTSRVYRYCTKLNEIFEQEIDPVMQSLGYCCGRRQVFQPQVLCCFGKQLCTIPRDAKYMSYNHKITYCMKCFSEIAEDHVTVDSFGLDPSSTGTTSIAKSQFTELKNDHLDLEPFVECKECGRKLHQVCVVHIEYIWTEGFVCDGCLKTKNRKRRENRYTAKRLPQSRLGTYIENRVNSFLQRKEAGAGEVTIRVVSSSEKTVEVKPGMKSRYEGEWPETFPYKAKALFAFEDFNGVDVCFFGMHVQEYGSDAPAPNSRRVYIAYLDSVHFFRPKQYRTAVYHEILLGYLQYAKNQGYAMAHIWACPPSEGDDYIFHCHPPEQKIPKPKRLQDWYKNMLNTGINERIVISYQDILKQAQQDQVKSAMDLPYFEGDFWPNVIEDSIKEIEAEQEKQQHQQNDSGNPNEQSGNPATDDESMDMSECSDKSGSGDISKSGSDTSSCGNKNQKKSGANKKSTKKQNQRKNNVQRNKSGGQMSAGQPQVNQAQHWEQELTSRIYATMEKHKEVFFVIRLHPQSAVSNLPETRDGDTLISCDLMDGRDAFLTLAREKHYEFSSLRRAKYSSVALLYELHNSTNGGFVYTCNKCKRHVGETRYHCTTCEDFDLCTTCNKEDPHPHKMEKLGDLFGSAESEGGVGGFGGSSADGFGSGSGAATSPGESRRLSIQRCIQSLVHACQCRDANCRLPSCHKMKCVVKHAKSCKRKGPQSTQGPSANCPICKQLIALCCYHAKSCSENKCTVPYCLNIKQKLKQQQMQQRFQQQQILRRRIANMNSMTAAINASSAPTHSEYGQTPAAGPASHKPMTVTPPPGALQAVQQVQAAVRQQSQQVPGGKGKGKSAQMSGKGSGMSPLMSSGTMSGKGMSAAPAGPSSGGKGANLYGKGGAGYPSPVPTPPQVGMRPPMSQHSQQSMDNMSMQQNQRIVMNQQQQQQQQMHQQQVGHPPQYGVQGQQSMSGQWMPQQQPQQQQRFQRLPAPTGAPQLLQQQLMTGNHMNSGQPVPHQQQPQQQQQQQGMMQQGVSSGQMNPQMSAVNQGMSSGNPAAMRGPATGQPPINQVLQELLTTLRSPTSPEQQQQVLSILKSNPQLMAAFIKQRQSGQSNQQQQQAGPRPQMPQQVMQQQGQQQMQGQQMQPQPISGMPGQMSAMQSQSMPNQMQQQQQQQQQQQSNQGQPNPQWYQTPQNSQPRMIARTNLPPGSQQQQQMQMMPQQQQQQRFIGNQVNQQAMYQNQGQSQQQRFANQQPQQWQPQPPQMQSQPQPQPGAGVRAAGRMTSPRYAMQNQMQNVNQNDDMLTGIFQMDPFGQQPQQQAPGSQNQQQQQPMSEQLSNLVENL